jgi:hypothetical protein
MATIDVTEPFLFNEHHDQPLIRFSPGQYDIDETAVVDWWWIEQHSKTAAGAGTPGTLSWVGLPPDSTLPPPRLPVTPPLQADPAGHNQHAAHRRLHVR